MVESTRKNWHDWFAVALVVVTVGVSMQARASFFFNATKLEANNSVGSVSSVTSGDGSRLPQHDLLMLATPAHPVLNKVAEIVRDSFERSGLVDGVRLSSAPASSPDGASGLLFADGSRGPDLFLTLQMPKFKEQGWFTRTHEITLIATLGNTPFQSNHSTVDDTTPPVITFHTIAQVEHHSTLRGFERPKYSSIASNLAAEVSKSVTNQLAQLSKEHGVLPKLPDYLYGPFEAVAAPECLVSYHPVRVCSYYGLLTHNQTFWRFLLSTNPAPQLETIAQQLRSEGWNLETVQLAEASSYYVNGKRNGVRLELFAPRTRATIGSADEGGPVEFVVHMWKPFSRTDRESAMDRLLNEKLPFETVQLFERHYTKRQREQFYERLEKEPVATAPGQLSLARMYHSRQNREATIQALTRAKALLATLKEPAGTEQQIQALAKQISPKAPLDLPVTAQTYQDIGGIRLTNDAPPQVVERRVGDPLLLVLTDAEDGPRTLCLNLEPRSGKNAGHWYDWTSIQTQPGGRSTGWSSTEILPGSTWKQSLSAGNCVVTIAATPQPATHKIQYSISVPDEAQ